MNYSKKINYKSECNNLKITLGTVLDYRNPKSVYFKISSWLSYNQDDIDVKIVHREFRKKVKFFLRQNSIISKYYDNINNMINITLSESRINAKKPSYFELDVTLLKKNNVNLPFINEKNKEGETLEDNLKLIINELLKTNIFNNNSYFNYHYTKGDTIKKPTLM